MRLASDIVLGVGGLFMVGVALAVCQWSVPGKGKVRTVEHLVDAASYAAIAAACLYIGILLRVL